jgi:L-iditol 2-dehydrogenase
MDEGVLLESLANALAAIRRVTLQPGNRVLIIGATPIGLAAIQAARLYSPKSLVLLGAGSRRLKKAKVLGATDVVDIQGPAVENKVRTALDGNADTVLLCGYGRYDFILAMELIGPMGRILVEGHYDPLVEIPFKPRDLIPKSITLVPNRGWSTPDFQLALELASNRMVNLKPLVTHTYNLDDWQEAFDLFGDASSDALQVSIAPHGVNTS